MKAKRVKPQRFANRSTADLELMLRGFMLVPGYKWHIARVRAELRRREKAGRR